MMKKDEHPEKKTEKFPQEQHKKTYVRPRLIEYGKIEKLTESGGTTKPELGVPKSRV